MVHSTDRYEKVKGLSIKTELVNSLINEIHEVFGDVPFPYHCGWNAAIAQDDWIDDPLELKKITDEKDLKDKWWNIPKEELEDCFLAQCYLDAQGVEFYLPAYLIIVLNDPTQLKYKALVSWLLPPEKDSKFDLYPYFLEKFSKINKPKKNTCLKVIQYIEEYVYDRRDTFLKKDIENILNHEFWIK